MPIPSLIVAGGCLLLLGLVANWLIRRRRGSRVGILIVALSSGALQAGCGHGSKPSESLGPITSIAEEDTTIAVWDNVWLLPLADQSLIPATQCGFKAATLALALAKVDHDPLLVAKFLRPTRYGVKMSDIKAILESHGFDVESIRIRELKAHSQRILLFCPS